MARYGDIKIPFENDKVNPVDPYGYQKLQPKIYLKFYVEHTIEYNIAVPHNIIGPNQSMTTFRNVHNHDKFNAKRRPIIYGDGEQKRCFSDIDDCIYCLDKLITDPKIISQTVNIGPDEEYISINDLYKILSNKLQFNEPPIYTNDRPNEVKHATCSSEKAREILKYKTTVDLSSSLDKLIKFIKKGGIKEFKYNYMLEIENENTPLTWKKRLF